MRISDWSSDVCSSDLKAFSVAKLGIADDPSFELEKATMANLDALYLGAYAIGQFTWGILADRFGPRVVVLGGLLISAVVAVIMGSFATLPIFATSLGRAPCRERVGQSV